MKLSKVKDTTINDLLKLYAEASAKHGEATISGNYRAANKQHDIISTVYGELRRRGNHAQKALFGLLEHPNDAVRGWAAAHAMDFAPEEGQPVLEQLIAKDAGIFSFTAKTTLEEWQKGNLKFPY